MSTRDMDEFPAIGDLEARARKRVPHVAWEYLASGTGADEARDRNIESLSRITLVPQLLKGTLKPEIETELFGVSYAAPIGIAPIGMPALIWPGADQALATAAASRRIPYTLSTVASETPEVLGPLTNGMGWFQLYPPRDESLRRDLLDRAASEGFTALVVTADVPAASRRERQRKAGVRVPPVITSTMLARSAMKPAWSAAVARNGLPRLKILEKYVDTATMQKTAGFVTRNLGGTLSYDYLEQVRREWDGPLVVKGILDPDDAARCVDSGADAIQVSNHGGRQLDGAPGSIDALSPIVDRVGPSVPVLFDGGVRDGLDVARAMALGASFVFCGRAFLFGVAALGERGAAHAYDILEDGLLNVMVQAGCEIISQLSERLSAP